MDYETEEQQVEALKRWWAENGKAVVAGVVLGVGAIVGWSLWQGHQERRAVVASDGWSRVEAAARDGDAATVESVAAELRDDHAGTLYAAYASLAAARVAIEAGDLDTAAERLGWVADEAVQDDVRLIARIRLARVEGALGRAEDGLARLPQTYPEPFVALVEEARGDLATATGDVQGAREAYAKARDSGRAADSDALTMKLDDLAGPVESPAGES